MMPRKRTTFLTCSVCRQRLAVTVQENGQVTAAEPQDKMAFIAKHIASCRGGKPPTAQDKGFETETEDG